MRSLLILVEHRDSNVNKNINSLARYSRRQGIPTSTMTYEDFLGGKNPRILREDLSIMFFFPFSFWNSECEIPSDTGVYGTSKQSYEKFKGFWKEISEKIDRRFKDRKVSLVIDPNYAHVDRDKLETHDLLESAGVATTTTLPKDLTEILERAEKKGVFIKARYGALGKGITYVSRDKWSTNYRVGSNGEVLNYGTDLDDPDGWQFTDITGNHEFLKRLLDLEVIVEEGIVPPELNDGKKFDTRSYVIFGEVPHIFIKENDVSQIVTNFSRGGTINNDFMSALPTEAIGQIREESIKAAKALNSSFLGVDCICDGEIDDPKVLEVQTFTGYPKARYFNLAKSLAYKIATTARESS